MDDFCDTTHSLLNLPSTDDNPLSCVWLKDTQDEDPKLGELCNDPSLGCHKRTFAGEELICFTEKIKKRRRLENMFIWLCSTSCNQIFSFAFESPRQAKVVTGYEYIDTLTLI